MNIQRINTEITRAVARFWELRDGGNGVRAGKTLDLFAQIVSRVVHESGLPNATLELGGKAGSLPGYFRPHKAWDIIVRNGSALVAAIEFKSQVGSIGKNVNNRTEEVIGSGLDLVTALEEGALQHACTDNVIRPFIGYLMVVEDGPETRETPAINMTYFPAMEVFLRQNGAADDLLRENYQPDATGKYPKIFGVSYLERYNILCKRLMDKRLYDAAALLTVDSNPQRLGEYRALSPDTSFLTFLTKLANHCDSTRTILEQ